jgi:hypothetical protein
LKQSTQAAKSMRLLASWAAVVWLGVVVAGHSSVARAQLWVLTGGPSSATDSLGEALVIQLADSGPEVHTRALSRGDDAEAQARSLLRAGAGRMVIWSLRVNGGAHDLRCVFQHGQAVDSTTTRLQGAWGPALERTIALKVRELLDEQARAAPDPEKAPSNRPDPAPAPAARRLPPAQPALPPAPSPQPAMVISPLVELGVRGMTASGNGGAQAALGVAAGAAIAKGANRAELWLGVLWLSPLQATTMAGHVSTDEWKPELSVHALRRVDPSWLGGYLSFALRVVGAEGTTAAGEGGDRTQTVPALGAGAEGRLRLTGALWARCALGAELALKAQSFAVDQQTVLELGTLRAQAELSLVFSP